MIDRTHITKRALIVVPAIQSLLKHSDLTSIETTWIGTVAEERKIKRQRAKSKTPALMPHWNDGISFLPFDFSKAGVPIFSVLI